MEVEGIMDFGELEEQTGNKNRMKGNWKKMEEYGGEEGETQVQRQRRGIFMRDNVALARCLFFKSFISFQILISKLFGIVMRDFV